MPGIILHYPALDPEDELARVVTELEGGWAEDQSENWSVEKAARICPVFRFLIGRAG